jgi:hypothetical protein
LLPAALSIFILAVARLRGEGRAAEPAVWIWILWSVFALALLPKMLLAPRLFHYGFCLGMPAFILLVVFFTHHLPESLALSIPGKTHYRFLAAALVLFGMLRITVVSQKFFYARKTAEVGRAGDLIRAYDARFDPRTGAVQALLKEIERSVPPAGTLAVLPEGVMLNYLSRRTNPSPYINFLPLVTAAYGETSILTSLRQRPPDYLILFHRDTTEFGAGLFGRDASYGRSMLEWIESDYRPVFQTGQQPLVKPDQFGAILLKHR